MDSCEKEAVAPRTGRVSAHVELVSRQLPSSVSACLFYMRSCR